MSASSDKRRVGLVIGQLTYGGAEGQLFELARALQAVAEPVVYCLSSKSEPYGTKLREAGVELRVLPSRGSFDLSRVRTLRRALVEDRIEVVHSFLFLASGYAYLATRGNRKARLVTSARNCKGEPNPLRRMLLRAAFRASSRIICNSGEMARFAKDYYGAPSQRTSVVWNGVDVARFDVPRTAHEGVRIGTVGRIEQQKNLAVFLDAAARFRGAFPEAMFEVVGEGSLHSHYVAEVERRGLGGCVSMPGARADIPVFLAGLDQFWLTSDWEGTPNVVLEAMAAGLPVVATRVGGTPEVIEDGVDGMLVAPGDASAVAAAAATLARDPQRSEAMRQRAAQTARERFSIGAMVAATRAVYEAALAEPA